MVLTYFNINPRLFPQITEETQEMLESDEPANVTRIEFGTSRELDRSTNLFRNVCCMGAEQVAHWSCEGISPCDSNTVFISSRTKCNSRRCESLLAGVTVSHNLVQQLHEAN